MEKAFQTADDETSPKDPGKGCKKGKVDPERKVNVEEREDFQGSNNYQSGN
jgi:hypothetical protein